MYRPTVPNLTEEFEENHVNKLSSTTDFRPGSPEFKLGVTLAWRQFSYIPLRIMEITVKRVRDKY
jgi:hypothetical protein